MGFDRDAYNYGKKKGWITDDEETYKAKYVSGSNSGKQNIDWDALEYGIKKGYITADALTYGKTQYSEASQDTTKLNTDLNTWARNVNRIYNIVYSDPDSAEDPYVETHDVNKEIDDLVKQGEAFAELPDLQDTEQLDTIKEFSNRLKMLPSVVNAAKTARETGIDPNDGGIIIKSTTNSQRSGDTSGQGQNISYISESIPERVKQGTEYLDSAIQDATTEWENALERDKEFAIQSGDQTSYDQNNQRIMHYSDEYYRVTSGAGDETDVVDAPIPGREADYWYNKIQALTKAKEQQEAAQKNVEAYQKNKALNEADQETMKTNVDALAKNVDTLYERMSAAQKAANEAVNEYKGADVYSAAEEERQKAEEEYWAGKEEYDKAKVEYDATVEAQKTTDFYELPTNTDFNFYSSYGTQIENPNVNDEDYDVDKTMDGYGFDTSTIQNKATFAQKHRDAVLASGMSYGLGKEYYFLTDDEVNIYSYLLAKDGEKAADDFVDTIRETLRYRQGLQIAKNVEGDFVETAGLALASGFDNFIHGVTQAFTGEVVDTSAIQYAASEVRNNIDSTLLRGVFDAGASIGNMVPSILLASLAGAATGGLGAGTLAGLVGSGVMGLSAGGNAYGWALQMGCTNDQASAYGQLVGAAEGGLQYLLGGVTKLGGKLTGSFASGTLAKVENSFLKISLKIGRSMIGEASEEYLQAILNPVFRNMCLGEHNEFKLVNQEALDAIIPAILTAGVLEGPSIIMGEIGTVDLGKTVAQNGLVQDTVDLGLSFDRDSFSYDMAQYLQDKLDMGETPSNTELGELKLATTQDYINTLTSKGMEELTANGFSETDAQNYTRAFAKMLLGESLTEKESNMIGDAQASAVMERLVSQHQDNVKLIQDLNAGTADETDPVKIETYKTALQQGRRNGITAVEKATGKPSEQALPVVTDNSGNQLWINGVTNVDENGRVTVALENGAMADIETLNFTGPKIKRVFQAAGQFDTSTAEAFIDNYDGFTDPLAYETGFRHVMEDAQAGLSLSDSLQDFAAGLLTDEAQKAAFDAGRQMRIQAEAVNIDSGINKVNNGIVLKKLQNSQEYTTYLNEIGKRTDIAPEQKVLQSQKAYEDLGEGNRADLHVPLDAKFLKGYDKKGKPDYDWPDQWGLVNGGESITRDNKRLPGTLVRNGTLDGNSVTELPDNGVPYSYDAMSLPYIPNPEAYHEAKYVPADEYYFDMVDAIKSNDLEGLNALLQMNGLDNMDEVALKELTQKYKRFIDQAKERTPGKDATYGLYGYADKWINKQTGEIYLKGGAPQYTFPLAVKQLIWLGIYK